MTTIQTYLYPNIVEVQFWDPAIFTTRNRVVYAKPVTIYQGVDNPIQVLIKNQDQKPVNLTGYSMQADIQDPANQLTVQSFAVTLSNVSLGRASFTISKAIVDNLDQRIYKLTFRTINVATDQETPMYIDDNFGVPLDLHVRPAYYSDTTPSTEESITIDGGTL